MPSQTEWAARVEAQVREWEVELEALRRAG